MNINKQISRINNRKLFLIDGVGAIVTAVILGVILPYFDSLIGLAKSNFHFLSMIAVVYSIYSFICYLSFCENWRFFLRIIAIANLLYCVVTLAVVVYQFKEIKVLGILYFIIEAIIISILAFIELKVARNSQKLKNQETL